MPPRMLKSRSVGKSAPGFPNPRLYIVIHDCFVFWSVTCPLVYSGSTTGRLRTFDQFSRKVVLPSPVNLAFGTAQPLSLVQRATLLICTESIFPCQKLPGAVM